MSHSKTTQSRWRYLRASSVNLGREPVGHGFSTYPYSVIGHTTPSADVLDSLILVLSGILASFLFHQDLRGGKYIFSLKEGTLSLGMTDLSTSSSHLYDIWHAAWVDEPLTIFRTRLSCLLVSKFSRSFGCSQTHPSKHSSDMNWIHREGTSWALLISFWLYYGKTILVKELDINGSVTWFRTTIVNFSLT